MHCGPGFQDPLCLVPARSCLWDGDREGRGSSNKTLQEPGIAAGRTPGGGVPTSSPCLRRKNFSLKAAFLCL